MPKDAKCLTSQMIDLPSYIFIRVAEDRDRCSRIDGSRRLWFGSWRTIWAAGGTSGQGGDDQGGSVGAITSLEGATTVSGNGASKAVPTAGLGSLAAMQRTQSTGLGNRLACWAVVGRMRGSL